MQAGFRSDRWAAPSALRVRHAAFLLCAAAGCAAARADEFLESFETDRTSWTVQAAAGSARLVEQRRGQEVVRDGERSETITVDVARGPTPVRMVHDVPPSLVTDELTARLWVWSNRSGLRLALRVVLPAARDARSNKPLTVWIEGDEYTKERAWQEIACRTSDQAMARKLRLLRAQHAVPVDAREAYVDQAALLLDAAEGTTTLHLDRLRLAPVVAPPSLPAEADSGAASRTAVEMRLDRMYVGGRPFVPRLAAYQGEEPSQLAALRLNLAWIPNRHDRTLIAALRAHGLWAMAAPPRATAPSGEALAARSAGLTSFGAEDDGILVWMLGTGVLPEDRDAIRDWREQVQAADRRVNRPIALDAAGLDHVYSRLCHLLGFSRPVHQTARNYREQRDWLLARQNAALSPRLCWTWIETEPDPELVALHEQAGWIRPCLEPEQIQIATYAALSAGCRGIGFSTTRRLDDPAELERACMMQRLCSEIELVEPLVATGTVLDQTPGFVVAPLGTIGTRAAGSPRASSAPRAARHALHAAERHEEVAAEVSASVIRCDRALLLIPVWYDPQAPFVPGRMSAHNVSFRVEGVAETADAWEVSPTHVAAVKERVRVAGGLRITLERLDTASIIVISSSHALKEELLRRMRPLSEGYAEASVVLAEQKLHRTLRTHNRLAERTDEQTELVARAQRLSVDARRALARRDWHGARTAADDCRQVLRVLQRDDWERAVRGLDSPLSTQHSLCYATLPDLAHLKQRLAAGGEAVELLAGGDFEEPGVLARAGWIQEQRPHDGLRTTAGLSPTPHRGASALRLIVVPQSGQRPPPALADAPLRVATPPIDVGPRELIEVTGWIAADRIPSGQESSAWVFDSLNGPTRALRIPASAGWRPFRLVRELPQGGPFSVSFQLTDVGELRVDDLKIRRVGGPQR